MFTKPDAAMALYSPLFVSDPGAKEIWVAVNPLSPKDPKMNTKINGKRILKNRVCGLFITALKLAFAIADKAFAWLYFLLINACYTAKLEERPIVPGRG